MHYRSDWPEVGLRTPLVQDSEAVLPPAAKNEWSCVAHPKPGNLACCLRAVLNGFETDFYGIPCWDLRLEAVYPGRGDDIFSSSSLQAGLDECVKTLLSKRPSRQAYVYAKVVPDEPLYVALIAAGFEEVERRRLYRCTIGDLSPQGVSEIPFPIEYTTLAKAPQGLATQFQRQLLDICEETFQKGNSRHFSDAFLLARRRGIDYILALMELNFRHVPADGFLIAWNPHTLDVAGFSVVGKKPALIQETYTQLLSAVRPAYQRRGIYQGLTRLLIATFPKSDVLLNVTHVQTKAIQRAYEGSGRQHLADTVLLRRVWDKDDPT